MQVYHIKDLDSFKTKLVIHKQTWGNRKAFPEHRHDYIEMIYAIQGNGTNIIDCFAYPVIPGDLYIIKEGSVHSFYTNSNLTVYNLILSRSLFSPKELRMLKENEGFNDIFTQSAGKPNVNKIRLTPVQDTMVRSYLTQMYQELEQKKNGYLYLCKSLLVMLLTQICRINAEAGTENAAKESPGSDSDSITRILDYINHHYLEKITRKQIAEIGRLNINYVSEFFRKNTGTPLLKYVNNLRLENARTLLISRPDLTIAEIAYRSGFTDTFYFTRLFHSMCGHSPSAFRKMSVNDSSSGRGKTRN